MERSTKRMAAPLTVKAGGQEGDVTAVFSTFGNVDSQGDVMLPGSIPNNQEVALVWSHDWGSLPVGKGRTVVSKDRALFEGHFFTDTQMGLEAYKTVKNMGSLQEYSFGFAVKDAEFGQQDGQPVRFVKGVDLFEVSPVLIGANRQTGTVAIKSTDGLVVGCDCEVCQRAEFDALTPDEKITAYYESLDDPASLKAVWSTAYVNGLNDSAFAVIEPGGSKDEEGKTVPRSLRHFPHHDSGGNLDAPHVRNGLARVPQSSLSDALKARAESHLRNHANDMGIGKSSDVDPEDGEVFADQIERVLLEVHGILHRTEDVIALRAKAGRALSDARRRRLLALRDELSALLDETDPAKGTDNDEEEDDAKGLVLVDDTQDELRQMRDRFLNLDEMLRAEERARTRKDKLHAFAG